MARAYVNVAVGTTHYRKLQDRLMERLYQTEPAAARFAWRNYVHGWPTHDAKPYAFKAYSLMEAASRGHKQVMWLDTSMIPLKPLGPIWKHAEEHGVWIARNGFTNYEWTADSAYPDLFPISEAFTLEEAREVNRRIPHVMSGAIALDLEHENGRFFLQEFMRLASETSAFCGPWINSKHAEWDQGSAPIYPTARVAPCGQPDVRGHRHDQTVASVLAWRLGVPLADPPIMAYKGGETAETILLAHGGVD